MILSSELAAKNSIPLNIGHKRLDHTSLSALQKIKRFKHSKINNLCDFCRVCRLARYNKLSFPKCASNLVQYLIYYMQMFGYHIKLPLMVARDYYLL